MARVIQLMKHLCVNIVCTTNCFGIFTIFQMLEKMDELIGVKCYRWADADDLPRGGGDGRLPIQVRGIVVPLVLLSPPPTNKTKKGIMSFLKCVCLGYTAEGSAFARSWPSPSSFPLPCSTIRFSLSRSVLKLVLSLLVSLFTFKTFVIITLFQGVARPKLVTELKARGFCPIGSKSESPTRDIDELESWASNQVMLYHRSLFIIIGSGACFGFHIWWQCWEGS